MRYTSQLDLLPFGQLTPANARMTTQTSAWGSSPGAAAPERKGHYQWMLLDLPHGYSADAQLIAQCDHTLSIVNVDANCHIRLHQQRCRRTPYSD
jgi:hypothetical protein